MQKVKELLTAALLFTLSCVPTSRNTATQESIENVDGPAPLHPLMFPGGGLPTPGVVGGVLNFSDAGLPNWLSPGAINQALMTGGPGGNVFWGTVSGGVVGNITTPPVLSSWTQLNFLGGSTTSANSGNSVLPTVFLRDIWGGGTGQPIRGLQLARVGSVGTSYTLTVAFTPLLPIASTPECGIFVSDGTKLIVFANGSTSGNNINEVKTYASVTATPSNLDSTSSTFGENGFIWYQIQSDTVHRVYSISNDSFNFITRFTETISGSTLVNTESEMGFYVAPVNTNGTGITIASWLQTDP